MIRNHNTKPPLLNDHFFIDLAWGTNYDNYLAVDVNVFWKGQEKI